MQLARARPSAALRAPASRPALPMRRAACVTVRAEKKQQDAEATKPATAVAEAMTRRGGAVLAAAALSASLLFSAVVPEQALAARSGGRASGAGFSRRAMSGGGA